MSAFTPPQGPAPAHTAVTPAKPAPASRTRHSLLAVSAKGCTHALKLRELLKVSDRARLEVGLDFGVDALADNGLPAVLRSAVPWAALQYQLDPEDRDHGTLRVDMHQVAVCRRFRLGRSRAWWEAPMHAKLGLGYDGKPHASVSVDRLPLALALGAVMLAAGKPVHLRHREVGGLALHVPIPLGGGPKHDWSLQERVELDASLRRSRGGGLQLDFHQINGVLRLRGR